MFLKRSSQYREVLHLTIHLQQDQENNHNILVEKSSREEEEESKLFHVMKHAFVPSLVLKAAH